MLNRFTLGYLALFVSTILGASVSVMGQAPVFVTQPVSVTVTLGQSATFSVEATEATAYQWSRDGALGIDGATSSSYTFTPTIADGGHYYNVMAYSSTGVQTFSQSGWLHVIPRTDVPTVRNIESFGIAEAAQVAGSFGLGVTSNQDWQFSAVADMGGRWVRADGCLWEQSEIQIMPANMSGGFALSDVANCAAEMASARKYGLHVDDVAYWAPPQAQIAVGVTTSDVPAGSLSIPLSLTDGSFAGYSAREMLVSGSNSLNARIDNGAPVDSISGTTLTLAEQSIAPIPKGTSLKVNVLLYPPVLLSPQDNSASYVSNPSIQAWLRYVSSIRNFMHAIGVTGRVELWNEPEQSNELWDDAALFYTDPPALLNIDGTGNQLAFAASTLPAISDVKLLNGWTDVSGWSSLYNPQTLWALPVSATQANSVFGGESLHIYGNNPEQIAWLPDVVRQDAESGYESFATETPIGGQVGANGKSAAFYNESSYAAGGMGLSLTEGGVAINQDPLETELERTRFDVREFLTFAALHLNPIIFYKAGQDQSYEWFGEDDDHSPHQVVAAFKGLLTDLSSIEGWPVASYSKIRMPQVISYKGYYPLATTSIVGSRHGDRSNSIMFLAWQKSYTVPPGGGSNTENYGTNGGAIPPMPLWILLRSPVAVPLMIRVPFGHVVRSVKDVVTQDDVRYKQVGDTLTYSVADDPIQVLLVPQRN